MSNLEKYHGVIPAFYACYDDNGKVSSISVTIYDSLEYMCSDLCLDLKLHENSGIFKYKRSKDTLLLDFM